MDSIVRRILGEADPLEEPIEGDDEMRGRGGQGPPQEREVEELANLWTTGNKGEVARRFMEMDNETSVKLVFAIGRDGAIQLARMVDQMMEQNPDDESTEPEAVEPPPQPKRRPDPHGLGGMFKGMDPSRM